MDTKSNETQFNGNFEQERPATQKSTLINNGNSEMELQSSLAKLALVNNENGKKKSLSNPAKSKTHFNGSVEEEHLDTEKSALINHEDQKKSLWQSTSLRQKFLLFDLVFLNFIVNGCEGLSYPFFSRVVDDKGGTLFDSALVLQTVMATRTIGSIVFGMFQHKIGALSSFYVGLVVTGLAQIAFGSLEYVSDITVFTALGVILKAICGLGISAFTVGTYAAIVPEYPDHTSLIFGLLTTAFGCARLVGPAYGGYMYDLFGMFVPLLIWGAVIILITPFQYFLIKVDATAQKKGGSDLKKFLLRASNVAILMLTFVVNGIFGYIDVVLTIYFQNLRLSVGLAGLAMLAMGGAVALFGPIVGYIVSKKPNLSLVFITGGSIAFSAALFIFSPGQNEAVVYTGCVLLGILTEFILVPMFEELLVAANGGPVTKETSVNLYSEISGIWYAFMASGILIVPIVSTAIQSATHASISIMLYSLAGILILFAVCLILFKLKETNKCPTN